MMTDQQGDKAPARRKGRSPSYPGIDLGLAVERAGQLWKAEHSYPTDVPTILGHWGYGAKSGGGFAAVAALKSFGLLDDQGNGSQRRASLTELAQDILTAETDDDRRALIGRAALKPAIHSLLWERFGTRLPSDQSLELFLTRERDFTPSGAGELASEWKRTMEYAKLTDEAGTVTRDGGEHNGDQSQDPQVSPPPTLEQERAAPPLREPQQESDGQRSQRPKRTIQIPYSPTEWALLEASFPMPEQEWHQMLAVLQAMKLGLVQPTERG